MVFLLKWLRWMHVVAEYPIWNTKKKYQAKAKHKNHAKLNGMPFSCCGVYSSTLSLSLSSRIVFILWFVFFYLPFPEVLFAKFDACACVVYVCCQTEKWDNIMKVYCTHTHTHRTANHKQNQDRVINVYTCSYQAFLYGTVLRRIFSECAIGVGCRWWCLLLLLFLLILFIGFFGFLSSLTCNILGQQLPSHRCQRVEYVWTCLFFIHFFSLRCSQAIALGSDRFGVSHKCVHSRIFYYMILEIRTHTATTKERMKYELVGGKVLPQNRHDENSKDFCLQL